MRDPKRIKKFCDELADIWETYCPDWRFGQFIVNVFGTFDKDPLFPEESEMIEMIRSVFEDDKN